jgi:protein SDA1
MNKTVRQNNQLPNNLPQLQNVIKRDPKSYHDEFSLQYHHYKALMELFMLNPSSDSKDLEDLIMFLAQVSHCYPDEMSNFPNDLQDILRENASILNPDVRMTLCKALILMRNKNLIPPEKLLEFFFELFRCQDKLLRSTLYAHIVADIKRVNTPRRNNKINNMLQSFMFNMINDKSSIAVRMALDVMVELYHRNIWNDGKTVNVISNACFSTFPKVSMNAISFFLSDGMSSEEEAQGGSDDSNSEDESRTLRRMIVTKETCKGKKRKRKIDSALQLLKKKKKKRLQSSGNFSALYLINDPQDFAEKLFKKLESSREKFNVRLMLMNLISKLIGIHQLFILNFYSCLQRYLQPHQKDVTLLLSFFAQSCHQLIPPEVKHC